MYYHEIVEEYFNANMTITTAYKRLEDEKKQCIFRGEKKIAAKLTIAQTLIERYESYNKGTISLRDFLLCLRNYVCFNGQFLLKGRIMERVKTDGRALGLEISDDGYIKAVRNYTKWEFLSSELVDDVYLLGNNERQTMLESSGDALLHRHTIFHSYRSLAQKLAVHAAVDLLSGYTMLISLPTGGGKSLISHIVTAESCLNMPALTLVIVPTKALGEDQRIQAENTLSNQSIKNEIYWYNAGNSKNISKILQGIEAQKARMLFISPEVILKNEKINTALENAVNQGYLVNVIVDEAHIVPDWGMYFRPEFQLFSVILKRWQAQPQNKIRTYLLSATLSEDVVKTLFSLFGTEGKNIEYRCDALRQEPRYIFKGFSKTNERTQCVLDMIELLPKPLIVYVVLPNEADEYCRLLKKRGYKNIAAYTGKTSDEERERLLIEWKDHTRDVMIATSAFGIGVDKRDVRTVIHACVPENLSRFYQEVGRGGRDGLPSLSLLLVYSGKQGENDLSKAVGLVQGSVLTTDRLIDRWLSMRDAPQASIDGELIRVDLSTAPSSFKDEDKENVGHRNLYWNINALLLLHRCHFLEIVDIKYFSRDARRKETYYADVKSLKKINAIRRGDISLEILDVERQDEFNLRMQGYRKMEELVKKTKDKCWSRYFTALFPLAEPECHGCPCHPGQKLDGYEENNQQFPVHKSMLLAYPTQEPGIYVKKKMGAFMSLMVPVQDSSQVSLALVFQAASKLQLSCIVLPEGYTNMDSDCMLLSQQEFCDTVRVMPWVFHQGIWIQFGRDRLLNNRVYDLAYGEKMVSYRKVLCFTQGTKLTSTGRLIEESVDGRCKDLESF